MYGLLEHCLLIIQDNDPFCFNHTEPEEARIFIFRVRSYNSFQIGKTIFGGSFFITAIYKNNEIPSGEFR